MRDALLTPRTRRAQLASVLVGQKSRTAAVQAALAALVAAGALSTIDAAAFGFLEGVEATDSCSITATDRTLTSPDNPWTAADVGKVIHVAGAGTAAAVLTSRIAAFTAAGSIELADAAVTTVAATMTSAGGLAAWGYEATTVRPEAPMRDASDMAKEAGRTTPRGASVSRSLADRLSDVVNAKDFGAIGDGATDDTVAIQAALTAAGVTYATVYLPRGEYRISAGLVFPSAAGLVGEGLDQSVIRYYGVGGTAFMLEGTVPSQKVKVRISDLSVYNSGGTGVNGINISYCHYSNLARLRVYGFVVGVSVSNSWNDEFDFIISDANTQDGFNLSTTDANALTFTCCQGVGNGRAGFYSEGGRAVLVSGCTWEANAQYGIYLAGGATNRPLDYVFHGCYIEGNGVFEFYSDSPTAYEPQGITIRDCYFEFIATKAAQAIRIVDGTSFVIDGNTFDNQGGPYLYSLYMAAVGVKSGITWARNLDKSTNGIYSEVYYSDENRLMSRAWGRFTVAGGVITASRAFGIASIVRISAGVFEITLLEARAGTNYCVVASAENGAAYVAMFCMPQPPNSSTVFRVTTADPAAVLADARTINFVVQD